MRCTKCGGDGTVDVTRFDPGYAERDVPITCSRCEGSGVIPDEIVSELESKETTIADLRRQVESKTVWAGHDPFTGEQVLTLLNENSDLRKQLAEARRVIKAAKYVARELEGEYFEPNVITQLRAALKSAGAEP